jgi:DNA processing protein
MCPRRCTSGPDRRAHGQRERRGDAREGLHQPGGRARLDPRLAGRARDGPVEVAKALRAGRIEGLDPAATMARAADADPYADLEVAQRHGLRLVVPESEEWPHFAFAALEAAGLRRLETYARGEHRHNEKGELIPPIALWIRGTIDLATVGVRSVAVVGARAATDYGAWVARDLSARLAERGFVVVSGGAHGIDAAAHRGALSAGRETVLVSAGGLDRAYPPGNATLFERVAESGLLISESPPGADPRRRRFLTRNRLIAVLGTGTVVVEAAERSGAMNTARHCVGLGRPLMAVPGPVTSGASAGCHRLIANERDPARLVTGVDDVLLTIGGSSDLPPLSADDPPRRAGDDLSDRLDALDPPARQVFDGFPARGWVGPDRLAVATGLSPLTVIRALPLLELSGLIESSADGYRIVRQRVAS